jgi:hypothetical protein
MKHFTVISIVLLLGSGLGSCVKEKDFPATPQIEFKEYIAYGDDSADCIIKFKDGDGDIGVLDGDTTPDLRMKYFYFDTTSMSYQAYDYIIADTNFDTLIYPYLIPNITPDGQYKALDGEIKIKLRAAPLYGIGHQKVKFEIRMNDRAGHISNTVTTNEIIVP